MKTNKKNNIHMDLNGSNLQNNQKKDYLRNLNHNVKTNNVFFSRKFFKDLGIVESVGDGIINILGLQKAANGEMVEICASEKNQKGLILNLGPK
jgi:F0F1-type ATP synthase alpha subunit